MNNNIDLTKILKDCPKGWKLYTPIFGEVEFSSIEKDCTYPIILSVQEGGSATFTGLVKFTKEGCFFTESTDVECLLFPSKEQRDWSKFTAPWYKKESDTIALLEKQYEQEEHQVYETEDGKIITYSETDGYKFDEPNFHENEHAWLYLVSDVLTWKDGIGQYLDDPRVQELAKKLCSEYAQKLYNPSNTRKNEQKSTDKIEPRFKVGDWVVNKFGDSWHIDSLDEKNYQVSNVEGNYNYFPISKQDEMHLWTIQDAKDDDVLACNEEILLFKSYSAQERISLYCWYNGHTNNFHSKEVIDILLTTTNKVCPATKEQRDTLMKAINDAGYEWDAEKKELKKLDLVPNKKPILEGLNMKTYNDINIGDTVYIWGTSDSSVDETTITEKYDDRDHWNLKFSNGCVGRALKNGTSSTMGMYACFVYSDKALRESINEQIKILSNIKI